MKLDLASVVSGFGKGLTSLLHVLDKGQAYCAEQGIPEAEMLGWRLAPDMYPLQNQLQFVPNLACQWAARAAGVEVPADVAGEMTLAEHRESIVRAQDFLASLNSDQFADRDSVAITIILGAIEPTMPIGQWVAGFATTNFYFHLSIAYAILRSNGVPLGKRDLFAGGL